MGNTKNTNDETKSIQTAAADGENADIEQLQQILSDLKSKNSKLFKIEDNLIQDNIKISNKNMSLLACVEEMEEESNQLDQSFGKYQSSSIEELAQIVNQFDGSFELGHENLSEENRLNIEDHKKRVLGIK